MLTNGARLLFILVLFSLSTPHQSYAATQKSFYRNLFLGVTAGLSAFDLLNRVLLFPQLDEQKQACRDSACVIETNRQQNLNAVGLGFAVVPPLVSLLTIGLYGLGQLSCPLTHERNIERVANVASAYAFCAAGVELGTVAAGLSVAQTWAPSSFNNFNPDNGRWIASTILSAASTLTSGVSAGAAVILAFEAHRRASSAEGA